MYQCDHCGSQYLEHRTNCANCGAVIKIVSATKVEEVARNAVKSIRSICANYDDARPLYLDDTLNAQRRKKVYEKFGIPGNETLIMVYDDTILGSNNIGFAICLGGLYWKNDWSVPTKRNFLTWDDFATRTIRHDGFHIDLGHGDRLGTAGAGGDPLRQRMVAMLNEIKVMLQG